MTGRYYNSGNGFIDNWWRRIPKSGKLTNAKVVGRAVRV